MPVQAYLERLNEQETARQEQARLRNQAASWRRLMRLPSPAATPLNPSGRFYEQVRLTDSTVLRPGNFFNRLPRYLERQQRRAERIQPPERPIVPALQQIAQGFAPTRASERQQIAFGVTSPEEYQRGITEEGARRAGEFGETLQPPPIPAPAPPMPTPAPSFAGAPLPQPSILERQGQAFHGIRPMGWAS